MPRATGGPAARPGSRPGRDRGGAPGPSPRASRVRGGAARRRRRRSGSRSRGGARSPRERGQLRGEDGRLELVQARVPALALGEVAAAPAVLAELPEATGRVRVVGRHGAAVPVGPEILRRVEGECGRPAEAACRPAVEQSAVALGAVLDDRERPRVREGHEAGDVREAAIEVHGKHEPRRGREDASPRPRRRASGYRRRRRRGRPGPRPCARRRASARTCSRAG